MGHRAFQELGAVCTPHGVLHAPYRCFHRGSPEAHRSGDRGYPHRQILPLTRKKRRSRFIRLLFAYPDAQAFVHKKDISGTEKRGSLTGGQKAGETVPAFKKRLIREALFGRTGRRCLRRDREVGRCGRRTAAPAGPACGARCLWLCQRGSAPAPGKTSFFPVRPRLRNKPDRKGSGKSIRQRYRNRAQKSTP